MPVRNQGWYDLNESRPWPLSDEASGIDDDGLRFPGRFISDLRLTFPETAGRRAMISTFTVTQNIVTAIIVAVNDVNDPGLRTPIASISLSKTGSGLDKHRQYALEPLYPGVGGWIVFGNSSIDDSDTAESYTGRFTNPWQSLLQPSTTRAYRSFPVSGTATLGNLTTLTGLVRLQGGSDIEIVKECREVPNNPAPLGQADCNPIFTTQRDVIVVRLKEATVVGGVLTDQTESNLFERYAGPCAGRPESDSCGDPAPIEQLGSVQPDCCGNIDIRMRGCTTLSEIKERALVDSEGNVITSEEACGVVISCNLGLADACVTADRLPDEDGRLPNEFDDLCESVSLVSETLPETPETSESFTAPESSQSAAALPGLPFCDTFALDVGDYEVVSGNFTYEGVSGDPARVYATPTTSQFTNVSKLVGQFSPFYRRVSARVSLGDSFAIRHNAGVIAQYRQTSPTSGLYSYYLAEADWDADINGFKMFRIAFFDGTQYSTELAVSVPGLQLGRFYDILFTIYANVDDPSAAWLEAILYDTVDMVQLAKIGPLAKANFINGDPDPGEDTQLGEFGMHTIRSRAAFDDFCVENSADPAFLGPQ